MTSISTLCNKSWWCIWSQFKWKPWSAVPGWIHSNDEARCHKGSISGHRGDTCTTLWQQLFTIWSSTVTHHWLLLSSHPENFQNLLTISPLGLVIILRSRRLWSCLICTPLGYGRKLLRWLDSCKVILKSSSLLIIWVDLWKYVVWSKEQEMVKCCPCFYFL